MFAFRLWRRETLVAALILSSLAIPVVGAAPTQMKLAKRPRAIAAAAEQDAPIKIGYILSLSGAGAPLSKDMLDAMNLYLDQIHHKIGGHPVELIVENDGSSPATAVAKYHKLVDEDKVDLISGLVLSHVGLAVGQVADQGKVPVVYALAAADDLTQRKHPKLLVRTCFSSSQPMHPFGEYAAKTLGFKKVVTVAMDYPFGYEQVGGFQKTFEENGGQVIQKLWAPLGFKDFAPLIAQINKDADAVFLMTVSEPSQIIPKQYKEAGFTMPLIGGGTTFDESILPKVGDYLVGGISALPYCVTLNTPANKKFVSAYKAKYGVEPSWFSECSYNTAMWIDKALQSLGSDVHDHAKTLQALKKVELAEAPRGPEKLDAFDNPVDNIYIRKVQKINGKYENVVIATIPNVSQFWKYTPEEFLKQPVYSKDYPPCRHCLPSGK